MDDDLLFGSLDESERPTGPAPDPTRDYTPHELATGGHLVQVHDGLRDELARIRDRVDRALLAFVQGEIKELHRAADLLTETLLSHLAYEERELVEPLARLSFY